MIGLTADYVVSVNGYDVSLPTEVIAEKREGARLHPAADPAGASAVPVVVKVGEHRLVTERDGHGKIRAVLYFPRDSAIPVETDVLEGIRGSKVEIVGHASPEGSRSHNVELSKRRAQNAAKIAEERGITVKSIRWEGSRECREARSGWTKCRKAVFADAE